MNKSIFSDLRSSGQFAEKPIIGLTMFIFGILVFSLLAYNLVTNGPLIQWDLPLAQWFHALALNGSPLVINIMVAGYYIGLQGVEVLSILLFLFFLYKRFWLELVMSMVALCGGGLSFMILSGIFNRPRPFLLFDKLIWPGSPNIPGFPSGHTLSIVVFCGLLTYLFLPKIKSTFNKSLVVIIALLVIFYIGFSRIYVGDHYLTDVIAGYSFGLAWLGLVCTLVELLFQRYHSRKERNKENYERRTKNNK